MSYKFTQKSSNQSNKKDANVESRFNAVYDWLCNLCCKEPIAPVIDIDIIKSSSIFNNSKANVIIKYGSKEAKNLTATFGECNGKICEPNKIDENNYSVEIMELPVNQSFTICVSGVQKSGNDAYFYQSEKVNGNYKGQNFVGSATGEIPITNSKTFSIPAPIGSVCLTKLDKDNELKTLPNTKYSLFMEPETLLYENIATDENGQININFLNKGSYYFIEQSPPSGYEINNEKIIFTVSDYDTAPNIISYNKLKKSESDIIAPDDKPNAKPEKPFDESIYNNPDDKLNAEQNNDNLSSGTNSEVSMKKNENISEESPFPKTGDSYNLYKEALFGLNISSILCYCLYKKLREKN